MSFGKNSFVSDWRRSVVHVFKMVTFKLTGGKNLVWKESLFNEGIEYIKYLFQIENI